MLNRLRLYSGLILFIFVIGHLLNLSLGLISVDAMVAGTKILLDPWHSIMGSILFVGAFLAHTSIAIWSIWRRSSLSMTVWDSVQVCLGLLAPFILAGHVLATRIVSETTTFVPSYYTVLSELWIVSPWRGGMQVIAVLVVWTHSCMGLHAWLRHFPTYSRMQFVALSIAVLIPSLALAGYVASGNHILEMAQWRGYVPFLFLEAGAVPGMVALTVERETIFQIGFAVFLVMLLIGRYIRTLILARSKTPRVYYAPGNKVAELIPGATLLESIQAAGIPHASVCGGRGRCSTCRVLIRKGLDDLPPASGQEINALSRAPHPSAVRLACQLRPTKDLEVVALVEPGASPSQAYHSIAYQSGREMDVALLFVDLRGSTKLSEERLPFDVVYIFNLFFAEMAEALQETNGHYAQFNGDGLLAIYGLESGPEQGCVEAIEGAKAMFSRLDDLNKRLNDELTEDLKIGVGIHTGEAIVGSMGPPASPIVSALGDNVNIAARLETLTKKFNVPLMISAAVADRSKVNLKRIAQHTVRVEGRNREVAVYPVQDMSQLIIRPNGKVA